MEIDGKKDRRETDEIEAMSLRQEIKQKSVPDGWKLCKINDLLVKVNNPVKVNNNEIYREIGIRSHGKGIFYKESITGKDLGDKSVFWIEPDCFIVNIVFAWELAVAKTTINEVGFIASHRFPMYKPVDGKLNIDFITYMFKSNRGKHLLNLASPGGAGRNKTLGQKEFAQLEVLVPSNVDEQKKIAEILSTWDKAIELKEKLIDQKIEQKKGLMQKLLTGKVRLPGFEGEWEEVKLGNIAEVIMGQSPPSESYNDVQEGLPLIQGNADCKNRKTVPRVWTSQPSKVCEIGDIIMTVRAPVGYISRSLHDACIGRGVCAIRGAIDQDYLYYQMQFKEDLWVRISQGSTFDSVNSKDIQELKIFVPLENEQKAIAEVLMLCDDEIELLERDLHEVIQQKKGFMQLLLTGKVRVKV